MDASDAVAASSSGGPITAHGNTLTCGAGAATVTSAGGTQSMPDWKGRRSPPALGDTVHAGSGALTVLGGTGSTSLIDANGTIPLCTPSDVVIAARSVNASGGSGRQIALTGRSNCSVTLGCGAES